jgi:ubiquitin-conjugating enzyme E2 G2
MFGSGKGGLVATKRLMAEYRELSEKGPGEGIIAGPIDEANFLEWECIISGPPDTPFQGGIYQALMTFPKEYPLAPPTLRFVTPIFHPNVYPDGRVCISILHPVMQEILKYLLLYFLRKQLILSLFVKAGEDATGYEHASERWSPAQSVEKILISVVNLLAEPNDESPANIDAAKMWRENRPAYEETVRQLQQ